MRGVHDSLDLIEPEQNNAPNANLRQQVDPISRAWCIAAIGDGHDGGADNSGERNARVSGCGERCDVPQRTALKHFKPLVSSHRKIGVADDICPSMQASAHTDECLCGDLYPSAKFLNEARVEPDQIRRG